MFPTDLRAARPTRAIGLAWTQFPRLCESSSSYWPPTYHTESRHTLSRPKDCFRFYTLFLGPCRTWFCSSVAPFDWLAPDFQGESSGHRSGHSPACCTTFYCGNLSSLRRRRCSTDCRRHSMLRVAPSLSGPWTGRDEDSCARLESPDSLSLRHIFPFCRCISGFRSTIGAMHRYCNWSRQNCLYNPESRHIATPEASTDCRHIGSLSRDILLKEKLLNIYSRKIALTWLTSLLVHQPLIVSITDADHWIWIVRILITINRRRPI